MFGICIIFTEWYKVLFRYWTALGRNQKVKEIMDPLLLSNKGDGFIQVGLIFSLNASGELCNKDVQLLLPLLTKNAVTQVTLTKVPYKLSVITTQEKTNPAINSY